MISRSELISFYSEDYYGYVRRNRRLPYDDPFPTFSSPYNHYVDLSPIELIFFDVMYQTDMVLYPQYPVEGYFADFANPHFKLIVELDGKNYHNKEKDEARDRILRNKGWTTYRLPGWFCVTDEQERKQDFCLNDWVSLLGVKYFGGGITSGEENLLKSLSLSDCPELHEDHGWWGYPPTSLEYD